MCVHVHLSFVWSLSWALRKWLNWLKCRLGDDSGRSEEPCVTWGLDSARERDNFGTSSHLKSIGSLSVMYAKMTEPSEMPFGWLTSVSPRNRVLDGVEIPAGRGNFWGLSSPFKGIGCLCCDVCNKRDYSVLNSVDSKIFDGNYRLWKMV